MYYIIIAHFGLGWLPYVDLIRIHECLSQIIANSRYSSKTFKKQIASIGSFIDIMNTEFSYTILYVDPLQTNKKEYATYLMIVSNKEI